MWQNRQPLYGFEIQETSYTNGRCIFSCSQHFMLFPEFQMPFLGEPFTGMSGSGKVVFWNSPNLSGQRQTPNLTSSV